MAKQWKKLSSETAVFSDGSTRTPYNICSEYDTARDAMLKAIAENNIEDLNDALLNNFVYQEGTKIYKSDYQGGCNSKFWEKKYFLVRPAIETLFFESIADFKRILVALKGKDSAFQSRFITTCLSTSIPAEAFAPLAGQQLQEIFNELNSLQDHTAAETLKREVKALIRTGYLTSNGIDCLEFKLNFMEILHSQDEALAQNSNYKCVVVNIAMIFFGFVPNLINWALTGNFLFCKNTPQQATIERIDLSSFGFFKPPRDPSGLDTCPEEHSVDNWHLAFSAFPNAG